ncbi:MAG: hypothetical protein JXR84_14055 [Anaerolineae bacterium]|nr:hypothetical protein [Anaerolineae bacterium]
MDKKKVSYTALGMLFGTFVGGGVGALLLAMTGQALYLIFAGLGTALGLIFGAGLDRAKDDSNL